MSEEVDCFSDALLIDVVRQGKEDRQIIQDTYDDPERAWLDGYVAGWFAGYFKASPISTQEEENAISHLGLDHAQAV